MIRKSVLAVLLAVSGAQAFAAISVNSTSFNYTQNFNTLANTGTSNAWANDATLDGWSLFNATGAAITALAAGDGSSNTGSFYSFGSTGSTERALGGTASGGTYFGSPASGAVAGWIAAAFTNTSGSVLNDVTIRFDGEQWRNGGNASAQSMNFEYGFGSAFSSVATWTAAGSAFNWTSPVAGTTAAAVDGNGAGKVANVGGTIAQSNWGNGATLWVRWVDNNDVGNDHGLAIDNFSLSVSAVPEPEGYAMFLAGLGLMGLIARRRSAR